MQRHTIRAVIPLLSLLAPCAPHSRGQDAPKSNGLFRVQVDGKIGFIDRAGKVAIEPQFDEAFNFSGGLALVKVSDRFGYIDRTGKYVWQPTK